MPNSFPLSLVLSWSLFFALLLSQAHHERELKAEPLYDSPNLLKALDISTTLGMLVGLGVLGYYFYKVAWYWPLALAVGGSMLGALLMALLSGILSTAFLSKRAFIGWPVCSIWAIESIHGIA